jgi:cobalt-zinc-cadmium efflux system outer membrane protein
MHWRFFRSPASRPLRTIALACALLPAIAAAQAAPTVTATTLADAFAQAWSRQPELLAAQTRRDAGQARRDAAERWTPEPLVLEASVKTDRLSGNDGGREIEAGVAVPLWLPGERGLTAAHADAEGQALESRLRAAQWRLAGQLREAWWALQTALLEQQAARGREASAAQLARDVARRMAAGDLSRADQNQADGAVATAQAESAEAAAAVVQARHALAALGVTAPDAPVPAEPLPATGPDALPAADHPALAELDDRARVARQAQDLAAVQKRANPELTLLAGRERGARGESYGHSLTFGVRVPLGAASGYRVKVATASAERIEAEQTRVLEAHRLASDIATARARMAAAEAVAGAAARRLVLAQQTRGFYDKSFRLGETDLPNRLRVELEAQEAERQSARARVSVQHAISTLRQALGLPPQ